MASGASKLIPADPEKVMVIRRVTPSVVTCSTPFLRMGRIKIGGRGTIVRLASGSIAVFSPVALTDTVRSTLRDLNGEVKYITALDQEHHIFLEPWHKEFPSATVIGPETLPAYRDKQMYNKVPFGYLFKKADKPNHHVSEEFDGEFDVEYVDGHANKELVFCHRPSKTLIEADVMFNLPATEQMSRTGTDATSGILTKIFVRMNSTGGDARWMKRFIWYAISAGDRHGFNASMARINQWDFDRIIPCHGDTIESGGKGIFQKVMAWHLEAARKQS